MAASGGCVMFDAGMVMADEEDKHSSAGAKIAVFVQRGFLVFAGWHRLAGDDGSAGNFPGKWL